jgi:hypothetical protein
MGDRSGQRAGAGQPGASGSSAAGSGQGPAAARGRRAVLAGAAAAGAGAAAGLAGRAGVASAAPASPAAVLLGRANTETSATSISNARGTALSAATGSDGHSALAGADTSGKGGHGVRGTSKNGTGVAGTSTHGYGLSGTSASDGWGVYGSSASGLGVYGSSTHGTGVAGVSNNGTGVEGTTTGDGQSGVAGTDEGTRGGTGVSGTSASGSGVSGTSTAGYGVYGTSAGGYGVYGYSTDGIGVYALTNGNGTALLAGGNAQVTGSLSKGGGSFKIDHPLDPARKYLYHSFVESPDMKNIYDGTVTLDRDGRALVGLPDWFEALNRDYRYQLTPIGGPAPGLHIAAEVSDGQFAIAGGAAGQKVSWQVTGTRQDAWANANRIPVEETKPAQDQGRYLHPELHDGEPITSIARACAAVTLRDQRRAGPGAAGAAHPRGPAAPRRRPVPRQASPPS